jgi:hypothetical protein
VQWELHLDELHASKCYISLEVPEEFEASPSIIRMIKSKRMRLLRHLALLGREKECI